MPGESLQDFNDREEFGKMAEYGEDRQGDHPERIEGTWAPVGEDSGMRMPEVSDLVGGESEAQASIDLMAEVVKLVNGDERWVRDAGAPSTWHGGGARLRLSWVLGEVTATFLPRGWRAMATWERARDKEVLRIRGAAGLAELAVALVAYGLTGAGRTLRGGAENTGAPLALSMGGALPAGQTELPVAPVGVVSLHGLPTEGQPMDSGMLPTRAHATDAGLDLYTVGQHRIPHGQWYDLPCGIAVEIPEHCWGMIIGRSSSLKRKGLMVQISVIDPGYRGPIWVQVQNIKPKRGPDGFERSESELTAVVGDKERIGQLILVPNVTPMFTPVWVESLGDSERGDQGFGSSGR